MLEVPPQEEVDDGQDAGLRSGKQAPWPELSRLSTSLVHQSPLLPPWKDEPTGTCSTDLKGMGWESPEQCVCPTSSQAPAAGRSGESTLTVVTTQASHLLTQGFQLPPPHISFARDILGNS